MELSEVQEGAQSFTLSRMQPVLDPGPTAAAVQTAASVLVREQLERGRRGLAICAPASGAGVTLITAGLGVALSQAGVRTLVVDANLRRPAMHEFFVPRVRVERGLAQVLTEDENAPLSIPEHEVLPNLSVVFAGPTIPGAYDLFDNRRFDMLVRDAFRTFDITLIDSPPANRCSETRRIAAVAGYAVMIARRNHTRSEDMAALLADLRLDRTEVIGSIFNEG